MTFDAAFHVARFLSSVGREEEASSFIMEKLPEWRPADAARVAPVVSLSTPTLVDLDAARCAQVLATAH